LPAPAAAGAEKKRRKVLLDKTNTPAIMPAPTKCSAPRIRGKAKSRTNTPSVGAAQHLGPNLEKLNDSAECFVVEGTVTGELGRQHYACGVVVGIICGRVPPGSRGGPVSAEVRKAAAEAPIEMFVLAHDGKQAGKQAAPGGFSEHFVGRCLGKIAQKMLAVPVADGQLRSPPVNAEVVIVPRVEGRAQVHTLDFVKAQVLHASDSGAASVVDHASALREYDAGIKALRSSQQP
jgi:hypothetical protein